MKILFLDESGDHNLTIIDKDYPLFVLAGIVLDEKYHREILSAELAKFKLELFGNEKVFLHYRDYTRNQNGFEKMADKDFRENFYSGLNKVISIAKSTLLACVIDKARHKEKYGLLAMDPYVLSLEILVERFVILLQEAGERGTIIAESRGNQLDNELQLAFLNLKIKGTRFLRPKQVNETVENIIFKKKEENVVGLQLVDTMVTPIGRRYLNKVNFYLNYETIKGKFRKINCGKYKGYGLVVLPAKKNG